MALINYLEKHLKTFAVKSHQHNHWEVIYITDGVGTIETEDNQVLEYKKGETICIPPYLRHINNSSIGFKNIHLTIEDWNPPIQKPFLIPESDSSKDFSTILKLAYRYFHQLPLTHPINLAYTNTIEAFLNTLVQQSSSASITHGVSPSKLLLQKRLTLAKLLLSKKADGYLRINEIAETCGFVDHAYFCRVFKKETGFTPNEFQLKPLEENKIYPSTENTHKIN